MIYEPELLIVLWTGKKLLFFGSDEKLCNLETIEDKDGNKIESDFLMMKPLNVNVSNAMDGTGNCTIQFVASDFPLKKLQIRFPLDEGRNYDNFTKKYYEFLHKKHIKPFIHYYSKLSFFEEEEDEFYEKLLNKSEPFYLFSPPQIIWVFLKDRKDDVWYKLFVGMVDSLTSNETSSGHTINITASNLLQLLSRVPVLTKGSVFAGVDLLKNTFYNPDETFDFYKYYIAFCYTPFINFGAESLFFDELASLGIDEIFRKFAIILNRVFGFVGKYDNFLKEIESFYESSKNWGWFESVKTDEEKIKIEEDKIKKIYDLFKEKSFLKFKLIDDTKTHIYEKTQIRYEVDKISPKYLFYSSDDGYFAIGRIFINDSLNNFIIKEKEFKKQDKSVLKAFQNILTPLIEILTLPKYVTISNIIRQITGVFRIFFHTDGNGNWILEYPKYNAYPIIDKSISYPENYEKPYEKYEKPYEDNDARYVLHKFMEITSYSETFSRERYFNFVQMPIQGVLPVMDVEQLKGFCTARSLDVENIIQMGLNEQSLDTIYVPLTEMPFSEELQKFFATIVEQIRQIINFGSFSATINLKIKPYFEIGRNVIIVHKERIGMITRVSHTIAPGASSSTTLTIEGIRPLGKIIPNPWEYYISKPDIVETINKAFGDIKKSDEIQKDIVIISPDDLKNLKKYFEFVDGIYTYEFYPYGKDTKDVKKVVVSVHPKLYNDLINIRDDLENFVREFYSNYNGNLKFMLISGIRHTKTKSGAKSRHWFGRALDIGGIQFETIKDGKINIERIILSAHPKYSGTFISKNIGNKICELLEGLGYKRVNLDKGEKEAPVDKAYIWNCAGHFNHIHISISKKEAEKYNQ